MLAFCLWLKIGFDAGYVEKNHINDFVRQYGRDLQQAYLIASATAGYRGGKFKKWCDLFSENRTIENRVFERSPRFDSNEKTLPLHSQNLFLQASEIDSEGTRLLSLGDV